MIGKRKAEREFAQSQRRRLKVFTQHTISTSTRPPIPPPARPAARNRENLNSDRSAASPSFKTPAIAIMFLPSSAATSNARRAAGRMILTGATSRVPPVRAASLARTLASRTLTSIGGNRNRHLLRPRPATAYGATPPAAPLHHLYHRRGVISALNHPDALNQVKPYDPSLIRPKSAAESSCVVRYRISSDDVVRREYQRFDNGVRIGKLLEDMDSGAGDITSRHTFLGRRDVRGPDNVTACVDGIVINDCLENLEKDGKDFWLEGRLIWVGNSSMIIRMRVWCGAGDWESGAEETELGPKEPDASVPQSRLKAATSIALRRLYHIAERNPTPDRFGYEFTGKGTEGAVDLLLPPPSERTLMLQGDFVFVALSPERKAVKINPLQVETAEDEQLFQEGLSKRNHRAEQSKMTLDKFEPSEEEAKFLHRMYLRGWMRQATATSDIFDYMLAQHDALRMAEERASQDKPVNGVVPLNATNLRSTFQTQPQGQNAGGKIFGGMLMRQAYELAVQNVRAFANCTPSPNNNGDVNVSFEALRIEDTVFRRPVPIGASLAYSSYVVYTKGAFAQVFVRAMVHDVSAGESYEANTFIYTFRAKGGDFPFVVPVSYPEMMLNLKGRRAFYQGKGRAAAGSGSSA